MLFTLLCQLFSRAKVLFSSTTMLTVSSLLRNQPISSKDAADLTAKQLPLLTSFGMLSLHPFSFPGWHAASQDNYRCHKHRWLIQVLCRPTNMHSLPLLFSTVLCIQPYTHSAIKPLCNFACKQGCCLDMQMARCNS